MKKAWKALDTLKDVDTGVSGSDALNIIEQALNDLERLKKFKETFDNYELVKRQDFIAYENWLECEGELEELKRDIARYFELDYRAKISDGIDDKEAMEYTRLHIKLLEVGKEE